MKRKSKWEHVRFGLHDVAHQVRHTIRCSAKRQLHTPQISGFLSTLGGVTRNVQTVSADTAAREVAKILQSDGCVVISGLVSPDTMDQIRSELEPYTTATRDGDTDFLGHATRRTGALIARSPTARSLVTNPVILNTVDLVLGDHGSTYQIDLTQLIDIGPGEPGQMFHRDQWSFDNYPFPTGFEAEIATMWAATEFTEEMGATRVIVGSNHWEDEPAKVDPALSAGAIMSKGSVLLYFGSLYHGGGANKSLSRRVGINIGYSLAWLRQEENQYLACPPDIARTLPEGLLRLMGYQRGAVGLGYVEDMREPI
ncbi:MAG: hypothetical protein JWM55_296, partial [Acidimicrobiaceae bacterium]|nr:hypothetical protein [Acidimicrobiaceae bacterium]